MIRILWGKRAEGPDEDKIAQAILLAGYKIKNGLLEIADAIRPRATKLRLSYQLEGGTTIMGSPVTGAVVGQKYNPSVVESNATTPSIPPIGPLVFASDNTAIVTVDAGGIATMVAAGTANVSVMDQGNSLTDTVAFTVGAAPPPVADKLTLSYTLA